MTIHRKNNSQVTYKKPIRQDSHGTKSVYRRSDFAAPSTVAAGDSKVPLSLNRCALEEDVPDEDAETPECDNDQGDSDGPDVHPLCGESQQKNANAQLDKHHINDVDGDREGLPLLSSSAICHPSRHEMNSLIAFRVAQWDIP